MSGSSAIYKARKLTKGQLFEILDRWSSEESVRSISEDFPLNYSSLTDITAKKTYKDWTEEWEEDNEPVEEIRDRQAGPSKRLTKGQVFKILNQWASGKKTHRIADDVNINTSSIRNLISKRHHSGWVREWEGKNKSIDNVKEELGYPYHNGKLNKEQVFEILRRADRDETWISISEDFPVGPRAIYQVYRGYTYKDWVEEWQNKQ